MEGPQAAAGGRAVQVLAQEYLLKRDVKLLYEDFREGQFSAKDASSYSAKSLWSSLNDTDGAIKVDQFRAPGGDSPTEYVCVYPEALKAYLAKHHPRRYGQVEQPSGDFVAVAPWPWNKTLVVGDGGWPNSCFFGQKVSVRWMSLPSGLARTLHGKAVHVLKPANGLRGGAKSTQEARLALWRVSFLEKGTRPKL